MKDIISNISKNINIWIKEKYIKFTKKISKVKIKKKVFLKLVNAKKDEEEKDS